MNNVLKTIARRRSVRKFQEKQIKNSELKSIIDAGLQAPSGHNDQSCYLTVVQDRALVNELSEGSKAEMMKSGIEWIAKMGDNKKFNIYYGAPTVIIVAARKDAVSPLPDACAAIENMIIAAESMKLGTCWIGFSKFYFTSPERYAHLGIPNGYEVQYAVAIGYKPKGFKANPPERKHEKYYHIIK